MREPGDVFSRECPVCGVGKLSYMNRYKETGDSKIRSYRRKCDKCGAEVVDTVERRREVVERST